MSPYCSFTNRRWMIYRALRRRGGFTLVEMMVVVGIMLILTAITATTIRLTINGDKVRAGGRQVQSYLEGARDRAIYAKAPRGVRFLVDSTNTRTVTSMVFIAPTDDWTQGSIQLELDGTGKVMIVRGLDNANPTNPTQWYTNLYSQGLLRNGARILIPNDNTGTWYTVTTDTLPGGANYNAALYTSLGPALHLTTPYISSPTNPTAALGVSAFTPGTGPVTYRLQLPPTVLPNSEPVLLPKGTVIDLDRCNKNPNSNPLSSATSTLPQAWINTAAPQSVALPFSYSTQMDVLFSPRGTVIGTAAGRGLIHFYVADQKDADSQLSPENAPGDKMIVSLFGRTGAISVHPVDLVDTTTIFGTSVLDYFKLAETGEVAGK